MTNKSTKTRPVKKFNLFKSLGRKMKEITEKELQATSSTPGIFNLYVLKQHDSRPETVVEERSEFIIPTPVSVEAFIDNPAFKTSESTYLVGYDIEFQPYPDEKHRNYPAKLLSHQWYFNFAGLRFGVILLTDQSLSTQIFTDILKEAIPRVPDKKLSRVFVYAYFSLVECGWMHPSMKLTKQGTDFFGNEVKKFVPLIAERGKEWHKSTELRTETRPKKTGSDSISWKVSLVFSDAKNLSGGGTLKDLGKKIGIEKRDIGDNIKEMEKYKAKNLLDFCRYGIIDSVIAAEAHIWYAYQASRIGLEKEQNRTASYSADLFRKIFIDIYGRANWKRFIGYEKNAETKSWKFTPTHADFIRFYYGGRNEAFRVGPQGPATYFDLRSAYPTALIMLPDYDFSCSYVYYGAEAEVNANILFDEAEGPFQVAGVTCSFRFRDNIHPIFPMRIDEPESVPNYSQHYTVDGLIFPQTGETHVTWPEFWVAKRMNLLEELHIQSLVTFRKLDSYELANEFYKLLENRGTSDDALSAFYKQILNYTYGKMAQGGTDTASALKKHDLDKKIETSPVTCFPLASYITGFCRAAVGELLQQNPDCYAITTDGFISPRAKLETSKCELCNRVQEKVGKLSPFIGIETKKNPATGEKVKAIGDRSLFIKTRGYLIVNGDSEYRKIAQMGAQLPNCKAPVEYVKNFLDFLTIGRFDKTFKRSLPSMRKKWRKDIELINLRKRESQKHRENLIKGTTKPEEQAETLQTVISKAWKSGKVKVLPSSLPLDVIYKDVRLNQTFDMKRIPINPTIKTFKWAGNDYKFVSFETKPLNCYQDFHMLRTLAKRDKNRYREEHRTAIDNFNKLQYTEMPQYDLEEVYYAMYKWQGGLQGEDLKLVEENLKELREYIDKADQLDIEKTKKLYADRINDASTPPDPSQMPVIRNRPPDPPLAPESWFPTYDDETLLETFASLGWIPKEVPYLELPDYQMLLEKFQCLERGHETEDPRIKEEEVLKRRHVYAEDDIAPASTLPILLGPTQNLESEEKYLVRLVRIRDRKAGHSRAIRSKAKEQLDEYRKKLIAVRNNMDYPKKVRDYATRLLSKIPPHPSEGVMEDMTYSQQESQQEPKKKRRRSKKKADTSGKSPVGFIP